MPRQWNGALPPHALPTAHLAILLYGLRTGVNHIVHRVLPREGWIHERPRGVYVLRRGQRPEVTMSLRWQPVLACGTFSTDSSVREPSATLSR